MDRRGECCGECCNTCCGWLRGESFEKAKCSSESKTKEARCIPPPRAAIRCCRTQVRTPPLPDKTDDAAFCPQSACSLVSWGQRAGQDIQISCKRKVLSHVREKALKKLTPAWCARARPRLPPPPQRARDPPRHLRPSGCARGAPLAESCHCSAPTLVAPALELTFHLLQNLWCPASQRQIYPPQARFR